MGKRLYGKGLGYPYKIAMSKKANLDSTRAILKRAFFIVYKILPLVLLTSVWLIASNLIGNFWIVILIGWASFFVSMGVLGVINRKIWDIPTSLSSFLRDCWRYGIRIGALGLCWILIFVFVYFVTFAALRAATTTSTYTAKQLALLVFRYGFLVSSPLLWFGTTVGLHVRFSKIFKGIYTYIRICRRHYPYIIYLTFFWVYLMALVSQLGRFRVLATGQISLYGVIFMGFYFLIGGVLSTTIVAALLLVYRNTGQPVDD